MPYCYLSTIEEDDAKYCAKIFPSATCFQYDYLADDVAILAGQLTYGTTRKMPPNLVADLANPALKWIILTNPPFATANTRGHETGKKSKDAVSMTTIREWMTDENYGEASRELFTQFLFRIAKEFDGKDTRLCLFSPLKYINSNNNQRIRDGFFQFTFCRGFAFSSKHFHGTKGKFPVGFLIWDLLRKKHLEKQKIEIDIYNDEGEKAGRKHVPSRPRTQMLNKWCPRPKWDGQSTMPTFVSPFNLMTSNKDQRNHIAPGFLCSLSSKADDFQNQDSVFLLSAPYANAGAFSVTATNFEQAMVLHAVKRIPRTSWLKDDDVFYAPKCELPSQFISDCAVWTAFAPSNFTVSLRNVEYQGRTWQIPNNLYPFLLRDVKEWRCPHPDIAVQLTAANEDRFLAQWLAARTLSPEATAVLHAAMHLYQKFYEQLCDTQWLDWHIETWDAGFYQIRQALAAASLAHTELAFLKDRHDHLRDKLLPQCYDYGFLPPDVEYFAAEETYRSSPSSSSSL